MNAPTYSVTTERLYDKLPDLYKETDANNDYQFKKYISAVVDYLGDVDLLVARLRYLSQIDLAQQKRYAQKNTIYTHPDRTLGAPPLGSTSDLVDPRAADESWLPWLGQFLGVKITPQMNIFESRDAISYASTGFRAGSKDALEKAVRAVLSGSKYAVALPHTAVIGGNIVPGTLWDLTILTRNSESPSSEVILATINKPTVKPAGVKLYHRTYQASWDALEASLPFWKDWETSTWDQIEQAGLSYRNIPGNVMPNPSFEVDANGWNVTGPATLVREPGGSDGTGRLRVSVNGTGAPTVNSTTFNLTANEAWVWGFTYQSLIPWTVELNSSTESLSIELPAAPEPRRFNSGIMPTDGGDFKFSFTTDAHVNDYLLLDSFVVKKS